MYAWHLRLVNTRIIEISLKNVNTIIALNKKGELPEKLEDYIVAQDQKEVVFQDAVGQDSINRFPYQRSPIVSRYYDTYAWPKPLTRL